MGSTSQYGFRCYRPTSGISQSEPCPAPRSQAGDRGVFTASETSRIRPPCAGPRLADRQLDTALDDSRCDGIAGEPGDLVDVEFRHEILPMLINRLDADAEFHRDLIVGVAFDKQLEHLHLPRSQAGDFLLEQPAAVRRLRLMIAESLGNGGAEKGGFVLHFPNRLGRIVGGGLFEQKTHRADRDRLVDVCVIAVRGENDHLGIRKGLAELWGRAGARCEFSDCNRLLYKAPVTRERVNLAEMAHIYSFSKDGPRGRGDLPPLS